MRLIPILNGRTDQSSLLKNGISDGTVHAWSRRVRQLLVLVFFGWLSCGSYQPAVAQKPAANTNLLRFDWGSYPPLPPATDTTQPGLAGAFIGIHHEALILAGGANFPAGPAWEGGTKVYHDDAYILKLSQKPGDGWIVERGSLPSNVAYGLSVSTPQGIVCVGGEDGTRFMRDAHLITWDPTNERINLIQLPSLPVALSNSAGDLLNNAVVLAGSDPLTQQNHFLALDLDAIEAGWQSLPTWPGAARSHAYGITQSNGTEEVFYLISGRWRDSSGVSHLHQDGFYFSPTNNEWMHIGRGVGQPASTCPGSSAGTAVAVGANHLLLLGGADGIMLNQLEQLEMEIGEVQDTTLRKELTELRDSLLEHHPGFNRTIWSFHTITESWSQVGILPQTPQVTTTALHWNDEIIIPSGEIAPCIRTPEVHRVTLLTNTHFGVLNYTILGGYLLILVLLGFYFSRQQLSTDDFFKAGQRIPGWAAGLSIFGTQLSAITFMAVPAKTFATDWSYFILNMTIIMCAPFIIAFFLPFYRRFNLTTAYAYLEYRFNLLTRLLGSSMYIALQLGRIGIVLLLPSMALSVVTGIDVYSSIVLMGTLAILYTVLGGIEAVIWTDVLQVVILLGGAGLALIILLFQVDFNMALHQIETYEKLQIFDTRLDFSNPTLWVVLLGGLATNVIQYGSDQTVVQRYLTTKDERSAAHSIWTGAWLTIPATLIFFALGTMLFVFYQAHPSQLNVTMENTDAIFPWFVVNALPNGVSGLLIAAVFAASMSSLDSSMNSVSAVMVTDFLQRLRPLAQKTNDLFWARLLTGVVGLMGLGLALVMATWGIISLWDQFNLFIGLFTGGLGGVFILGIFTQRTNGQGAIIGLVSSGIIQYGIKEYTSIHFLLYAFTGMMTCIIIGYLTSHLWPASHAKKLTWTFTALPRT